MPSLKTDTVEASFIILPILDWSDTRNLSDSVLNEIIVVVSGLMNFRVQPENLKFVDPNFIESEFHMI